MTRTATFFPASRLASACEHFGCTSTRFAGFHNFLIRGCRFRHRLSDHRGSLILEAESVAHAQEWMPKHPDIKHPGIKYCPFEIRPADATVNALIEARGLASQSLNR